MSSRSYIEEHQQYRPPQRDGQQADESGIESVYPQVSHPKPIKAYRGVRSSQALSPKVVESGVSHTLSHSNCQPPPGQISNRMVATLFYRSKPHTTHTTFPDRSPDQPLFSNNFAPQSGSPEPQLDPEPLDHFYGSYISPLCLTSFLDLISSLPLPPGSTHLSSSHRCLDTLIHPRVVELTFSPAPDSNYLTLSDLRKHELLYHFEREWNLDIVLQPDTPFRRYPRLVVFDMDSTLIQQEVIDLIAASVGVEPQVSAITKRAMEGELDFSSSLRERVALLKGVDSNIFHTLRSTITVTPGARQLIRTLRRLGVKTAVLSGGFIPLTQWLAEELGIDYAHANSLVSIDGKLTGEVSGTIVDADRKALLLVQIARKENIDLSQVIAIGDGANDLLMMKKAALGIAFNAKPKVQFEAGARLNGESLLDFLFLLGFTAEETDTLIS